MKIAAILILGILAGLVIAHAPITGHFSGNDSFAALHGSGEGAVPSSAMSLMQTDTALCDQPYFIEVYELSVSYAAVGSENMQAEEFADILFTHARESGYFTAEEAESWIEHIEAIPGQLVDIYREDPTVLDNCYNFQVAAVGPPA